jgi:hypothetical protein
MQEQITLFELKDSGFISPEQRRISKENPFFKLFDEKTLADLGVSDETTNKAYYAPDKHPILEAFWTAQTIALEKLYTALDERFLRPYAGSFQISREDGTLQTINYEFEPDYHVAEKPRKTPPRPRLQFFSEEASPISCTGYRNEFLNIIPFSQVSTMEELVTWIVRSIVKRDDCRIIF